jgi:hypothetical protein
MVTSSGPLHRGRWRRIEPRRPACRQRPTFVIDGGLWIGTLYCCMAKLIFSLQQAVRIPRVSRSVPMGILPFQ